MHNYLTNKGTALFLLSWICFVVIPVVNAQNPGSETHWMRLCASEGIILIPIEGADDSQQAEHNTHCPCAQNLAIPIAPAAPAIHYGRSILSVALTLDHAPLPSFSAYRTRAPPQT